jgi:hypothetical protein
MKSYSGPLAGADERARAAGASMDDDIVGT